MHMFCKLTLEKKTNTQREARDKREANNNNNNGFRVWKNILNSLYLNKYGLALTFNVNEYIETANKCKQQNSTCHISNKM